MFRNGLLLFRNSLLAMADECCADCDCLAECMPAVDLDVEFSGITTGGFCTHCDGLNQSYLADFVVYDSCCWQWKTLYGTPAGCVSGMTAGGVEVGIVGPDFTPSGWIIAVRMWVAAGFPPQSILWYTTGADAVKKAFQLCQGQQVEIPFLRNTADSIQVPMLCTIHESNFGTHASPMCSGSGSFAKLQLAV